MTSEKVLQIANTTKKWARNNGFEQDAEDMTQYVLLNLSQKRKASVPNICIDYVRRAYGRLGRKKQISRSKERRFYSQINDELHGMALSYDANMESMDFEVFQNQLDKEDRAILTLHFKWGMTENEIADCFGVTIGNVSQKISKIMVKLRDFLCPNVVSNNKNVTSIEY